MNRHRVLLAVLVCCFLVVFTGDCVGRPGSDSEQETISHGRHLEEGAMTFDDKRFEEVELNSLGPSLCSPEVPADRRFRGIIIVTPRLISFSPTRVSPLTIPACGFLRQEALRIPKGGAAAMHLVVINRKTGKEYSGYPVFSDMSEPPPPSENPIRPEEHKGIVVGVYFNFDLMEMLRLPRENAVYDAWLELGEEGSEHYLRSNDVTFRLLRRVVPGSGQDNPIDK